MKNTHHTLIGTLGLLATFTAAQAATITISGNQVLQGQTNSGELVSTNNGANNNSTAIQVRNGYTLTVETGATVNTTSGINVSQGVNGNGANITQDSGSNVNIGSTLSMSNNVTTGGTSFYTIAGGTLDITSNLNVGTAHAATFAVQGDSSTVNVGGALNAELNSIFNFAFGATGTNAIDVTGAFILDTGASLGVDGSSYTGGAGTISLFSYGSREGTDEFAESVTGFTGFTTDVVYGVDSVDLVLTAIPEPSTSLMGLLGLGSIMLRRRR